MTFNLLLFILKCNLFILAVLDLGYCVGFSVVVVCGLVTVVAPLVADVGFSGCSAWAQSLRFLDSRAQAQ